MTNTSDVKMCMAWFCNNHKATMNVPYMISYGKDQAIIKQVAATYGVSTTCQLIDLFFKEIKIDPFLQKTGASVGVFKTQIPKLIMKVNEKQDTEQIGRL